MQHPSQQGDRVKVIFRLSRRQLQHNSGWQRYDSLGVMRDGSRVMYSNNMQVRDGCLSAFGGKYQFDQSCDTGYMCRRTYMQITTRTTHAPARMHTPARTSTMHAMHTPEGFQRLRFVG